MSIFSGMNTIPLLRLPRVYRAKQLIKVPVPDMIYLPLEPHFEAYDIEVKMGEYVVIGSRLAHEKKTGMPVYATVSGFVRGIEPRLYSNGHKIDHLCIENDHMDAIKSVLPIGDPDHLLSNELVEAMRILGLRGMGGEGYPTYLKYKDEPDVDTLIINGVECEPYLRSNSYLMYTHIKALFEGVRYMMKAAGIENAFIAVKETARELIDLMREEAKNYKNIVPVDIKDSYPMGWERNLIDTILNRHYDRYPSECGVIVNNAETVIAFAEGLRTGILPFNRIITVGGDGLKQTALCEVRVGTSVYELLEAVGGLADKKGKAYLLAGGPMRGIPMDSPDFVVTDHLTGVTSMIDKSKKPAPCIHCGDCTLQCPMNLQPVKIMDCVKKERIQLLEKLEVDRCMHCGLCSYVCPSHIDVLYYIHQAQTLIEGEDDNAAD